MRRTSGRGAERDLPLMRHRSRGLFVVVPVQANDVAIMMEQQFKPAIGSAQNATVGSTIPQRHGVRLHASSVALSDIDASTAEYVSDAPTSGRAMSSGTRVVSVSCVSAEMAAGGGLIRVPAKGYGSLR